MKTNRFYALTPGDKGGSSLHQKILVVLLSMALIFASLPVASVFAAPASDEVTKKNLELAWANKLRRLQGEMFFFNNFQLQPGKFTNAADWAKAQTYLAKYRSALSQAQTIMANHDGFDTTGKVTDEERADESVRALAAQLHTLRGLRAKLGGL